MSTVNTETLIIFNVNKFK